MTKENKSVKSQEERRPFAKFPLEVTPDRLVVPSWGHLDVQIKNPTDVTFRVDFDLDSYSFDVDFIDMKDGKETKPFCWDKKHDDDSASYYYGELKVRNKRTSQIKIQSGNVIHLRITCEGRDEEIKRQLYFDESRGLGHLFIKCSLTIQAVRPKPEDTEYASGFNLSSCRYFLLSIDPECKKAKELAEKFSEHQKQHAREQRVIACSLKEDRQWIYVSGYTDCMDFGPFYYGPKIDQMSDNELKKIKEGYRNAFDEAKKAEWKKEEEKYRLEKEAELQGEEAEKEKTEKKKVKEGNRNASNMGEQKKKMIKWRKRRSVL
uniref:Major sperm protein n=1 Tax=Caenorhabditis tropicalis TaxID=1561998 RepID=A0A1I7UPI9_9PELO